MDALKLIPRTQAYEPPLPGPIPGGGDNSAGWRLEGEESSAPTSRISHFRKLALRIFRTPQGAKAREPQLDGASSSEISGAGGDPTRSG